MQQFIWNDLVRITVGEMSRADYFDYSREISGHLEGSAEEFVQAADDLLVMHAPTIIEVCIDGQWKRVEEVTTLGAGLDTVVLKHKMSINDVRKLPIGLFNQWSLAATGANAYIRNLFLAASSSPSSTPSSSASPSGNGASSALPKRKPSRTKTPGSKTRTPRNSSAG